MGKAVTVARTARSTWGLYHQWVTVLPARLHVVVEFRSVVGVARKRRRGVVVVHEARHDDALIDARHGILRNAVALVVTHTVNAAVAVVVTSVKVVREWTLEEVKTNCWGVHSVSNRTFVVDVRIVDVTQTARNVTTNDVVEVVAQIRIKPRREVGVRQAERRLVNNAVVVERHVVDLVVRRKGKCLCANLKAHGAGIGLSVHVTAVVVYPPDGLVSVEDVRLFKAAVVCTVKVVGGVVLVVVVASVSVQIDERGKRVGKLSFSSVCGPLLNNVWNVTLVARVLDGRIAVWVVLAQNPTAVRLDFLSSDDPVAVVLVTDVLSDRGKTVG